MNKQIGIFIASLILFLTFIPLSFATNPNITFTTARVPVPVKITVANENWNTTFTICNTTSQAIPLTDIELDFAYDGTIKGNSNIWGIPWAAWHLGKTGCGQVMLLGGTQWTQPLQPDPNCLNPMTVVFAANAAIPLPKPPFVFKAGGSILPAAGTMNVTMQAMPAAGLGNPQVTVNGMGITQQQIVAWGGQWQISNLTPGAYTVTSNAVDNGTDFFQAAPVSATIVDQATTQVAVVYARVQSAKGKLTVNMQAAPANGLPNPKVTVTGTNFTQTQVVNWGGSWVLADLDPGSYRARAVNVNNGVDFFIASPIDAIVNPQGNTAITVIYKRQA